MAISMKGNKRARHKANVPDQASEETCRSDQTVLPEAIPDRCSSTAQHPRRDVREELQGSRESGNDFPRSYLCLSDGNPVYLSSSNLDACEFESHLRYQVSAPERVSLICNLWHSLAPASNGWKTTGVADERGSEVRLLHDCSAPVEKTGISVGLNPASICRFESGLEHQDMLSERFSDKPLTQAQKETAEKVWALARKYGVGVRVWFTYAKDQTQVHRGVSGEVEEDRPQEGSQEGR
jgi:hypothetical protein